MQKFNFDQFFILLTIATSLFYCCNDLQNMLMGEIVRKVFVIPGIPKSSDSLGGYTLVLYELGCLLGGLTFGKSIDKYQKHKITLSAYIVIGIIPVCGLGVSYYFINFPVLLVSNTLLGVCVVGSYVAVYSLLLQHSYPTNPAFVSLIFEGLFRCAMIVFGEICRMLINYFTGIAVIIFMCIFLLLALITATFLQPTFQRDAASNLEQNTGENKPLLKTRNE